MGRGGTRDGGLSRPLKRVQGGCGTRCVYYRLSQEVPRPDLTLDPILASHEQFGPNLIRQPAVSINVVRSRPTTSTWSFVPSACSIMAFTSAFSRFCRGAGNSSTRIIGRLFWGLVPDRDMIQTQAYRRGVSKRQPGDLCMDQEKSAYPEDSEVFSTAATFAGLGLSESSAISFRAHKRKLLTYKP